MKTFIKTVAITLCLSVTMLFLSSSKKVEAVATGTATLATAAVVAIGTLIVGVITYIASEMSVPAVKSYVNSSDFKNSISVDDDGTATYTASSSLPSSINAEVFNAAARKATSQYNSNLKMYICDSGRPDYGPPKIPSNSLDAAITGTLLGLIADASDDSNPFFKLKDYEETGDTSISTVDGKPQKVTTSEAPTKVEIFDYMNLEYTTYSSLFDFQIRHVFDDPSSNVLYGKYYAPYIIKNNNLYVMTNGKETAKSATSLTIAISRSNTYYNFAIHGCSFGIGNYGVGPMSTPHSGISTRLANVDNSLCWAFYSFDGKTTNPSQLQAIFGYPSAPVSYPVLFSDPPSFEYSGVPLRTFNNYVSTDPFVFVNPANGTDVLSESDVLQSNFDTCGYFISDSPTAFNFSNSIGTAAKMMSGTEGNAVSGGTKTTYSDLSDLEKALYALAEQQGITYEQMLEQSNIVIENGEMYIEGLDGVQHSIESLLSEFEKLLEQGSINNENTAATVEQLTAILEYLKSLNIEGLGTYIQQLEGTLDDLKQGDKDREAVLGDISGQLTGLKEYLDSLGLSEIGAEIKNISQILSDSSTLELNTSEIENINADWYIEKFPFCLPFDFYRILTLFVRDPVPPVFTVPIKAEINAFGLDQSVDEEIVLDLTVFKVNGVDIVQVVLNFVCILGFVLTLIHITTKFFV